MTLAAPTLAPREDRATTTAGLHAPLTFIRPQQEKPVLESAAFTGGAPRHLFETESHEVFIGDLRPVSAEARLDREGFALRRHVTAVADLYDDAAVARAYYPESTALLQREFGPGVTRVVIFDATRRSDGQSGAANPDGARGPAGRIHVDYTEVSGPRRARDILGAEEVDRLAETGGRIVQVNIWRPISGPVRRSPLALADASTVRPEDLIATDQVFPDRVGEIYHLAHNPGQRWYYVSEMTRDEVLLIKGWDSRDDGRARFTPHSAFSLPQQDETAPPRESIELRSFVVIE